MWMLDTTKPFQMNETRWHWKVILFKEWCLEWEKKETMAVDKEVDIEIVVVNYENKQMNRAFC